MPVLLLDLDETLLDRTSTFRRWAQEFSEGCGGSDEDVKWLIDQDRGGYRPKDEFVALVNKRLAPSEALTVDRFRRTLASLRATSECSLPSTEPATPDGGWRS